MSAVPDTGPAAGGTSPGRRGRVPRKVWLALLAVATLLAWAPLVAMLVAAAVAGANGCRLDESGSHPCIVGGRDIGEVLVVMFVMGWLMILAFPVMAGTALLWIILLVRRLRRPRP